MSGSDIVKYGDAAMYEAEPMKKDDLGNITPQVTLLSATPDPLGSLAACFRQFAGKSTRSLSDITDDERRWAWEESLKTHLKAPWEFIDFHFFIEGVTRSWTHQLVRQRTAVYVQESLRFAVKEGLADEVAKPPHVMDNENAEAFWDQAVKNMERAYKALISMGIPAEDARGLLPHATTTRVHYKTNLRGLIEHAGNRLCTQAQFEWRAVFIGIMRAIRGYPALHPTSVILPPTRWQFETIAKPIAQTFTPVCYKVGHCVFMSELDRGCTIRDRVQEFAAAGVPAERWGEGHRRSDYDNIMPIDPMEWMADPEAGITHESRRVSDIAKS